MLQSFLLIIFDFSKVSYTRIYHFQKYFGWEFFYYGPTYAHDRLLEISCTSPVFQLPLCISRSITKKFRTKIFLKIIDSSVRNLVEAEYDKENRQRCQFQQNPIQKWQTARIKLSRANCHTGKQFRCGF